MTNCRSPCTLLSARSRVSISPFGERLPLRTSTRTRLWARPRPVGAGGVSGASVLRLGAGTDRYTHLGAARHDDQDRARLTAGNPLNRGAAGTGRRCSGGVRGTGAGAGFRGGGLMFEKVSLQVESSPCCHWGTPFSVHAPHARNDAMFGPVGIGDSSTHRGAAPVRWIAIQAGERRSMRLCGRPDCTVDRIARTPSLSGSPNLPDAAIATPWQGGIGGGESPGGRSGIRRRSHGGAVRQYSRTVSSGAVQQASCSGASQCFGSEIYA